VRVLVATDGTWGDVAPLLAVARDLRLRGHSVLALLNPSFAGEAERLGLDEERAGVPWEERLLDVDPTRLMRPVSGTIRVLRDLLIPQIPSWVAATERAANSFGPDAGVVHHFCWGALWSLHQRGLPVAATFLAPAALMSADDPVRPLPEFPSPPRLLARANGRILKSLFRRILDRPAGAHFGAAGLPAPRDLFFLAQRIARISLALWSPHLRGPARDDPPHLHICGCAFPVEPDPLPPELEAHLDAGEPPVVVTLGTSARAVGMDLYRAAAEASERIGRRAVLLTGGSENRPDPLPAAIAAFDEAPHGKLLPRACAIVHHGGAGTAAQALRAGKPAVIVPFGHDQADNAYRVEKLGGAWVVPRRRASADRLARTLDEMLGSPAIRESARRIGEMVRREDGSGKAARLVETLV
jgi:UDP:flavonoid glycosyltransferase YjiC (YdhE family)